MTTKLEKTLRREIRVGQQAYTLTIDDRGLKLVEKGRRKGIELVWKDLVSGDAQLATALQASVMELPGQRVYAARRKKA